MSQRANGGIWLMRALFVLYFGLEILFFLRVIPGLATIGWALRIGAALLTFLYVRSLKGNAVAWTAFVFLTPIAVNMVGMPLLQRLPPRPIIWAMATSEILPVLLVLVAVHPRASTSRYAEASEPSRATAPSSSASAGRAEIPFVSSDPESARLAAELKSKGYSDADLLKMSELAKGIAQSMYEQKTGVSTCRKCGRSLKAMQSGVYGGSSLFDSLSNTPYNCKSCGAPFCVDCMTKLRKASGAGTCPVCGGDIGW